MVAYKKITKEARESICRKMVNNLYDKSDTKKLVKEIQKEYEFEMTKYIPAEAEEFAKKYPKSVKVNEFNFWTRTMLPREDRWSNQTYFNWPYLQCKNVIMGFTGNDKLDNGWYCDYDVIKNHIKKENIALYNKINDELVPLLKDLDKFASSLKCALDKITTVNKLKEEIPEAYEIYVNIYGVPKETVPCSKKQSSFCDTVEKIRAQYNKK